MLACIWQRSISRRIKGTLPVMVFYLVLGSENQETFTVASYTFSGSLFLSDIVETFEVPSCPPPHPASQSSLRENFVSLPSLFNLGSCCCGSWVCWASTFLLLGARFHPGWCWGTSAIHVSKLNINKALSINKALNSNKGRIPCASAPVYTFSCLFPLKDFCIISFFSEL